MLKPAATTFRCVVNPTFSFLADFVEQVTRCGLPADATEVYQARNRIVACERSGVLVNIKAFRLPNAINRYVYSALRKSKAERSYLNAMRLNALGFSTPAPIAFSEVRTPGRLHQSYYFSVQIPGSELRHMDSRADAPAVLFALGREIALLHQARVWMKDFSPGNVLETHTPDGSYTFSHVDLNRIQFGCRSRSSLMRMFGAMVYTPRHLRMISDGYADALGLDPDAAFADASAAMRGYEYRVRRKNFLKNLFRKSR